MMTRLIGYGTRIDGVWRIVTPLATVPLSTIFPAPSSAPSNAPERGKE